MLKPFLIGQFSVKETCISLTDSMLTYTMQITKVYQCSKLFPALVCIGEIYLPELSFLQNKGNPVSVSIQVSNAVTKKFAKAISPFQLLAVIPVWNLLLIG